MVFVVRNASPNPRGDYSTLYVSVKMNADDWRLLHGCRQLAWDNGVRASKADILRWGLQLLHPHFLEASRNERDVVLAQQGKGGRPHDDPTAPWNIKQAEKA